MSTAPDHSRPAHCHYPASEPRERRDGGVNLNTWMIGLLTAAMLGCGGYFGQRFIVMGEDVAVIKASMEEMKASNKTLWEKVNTLNITTVRTKDEPNQTP